MNKLQAIQYIISAKHFNVNEWIEAGKYNIIQFIMEADDTILFKEDNLDELLNAIES